MNFDQHPYRLAARAFHDTDTAIAIGDTVIGAGATTIIAGPCAIESYERLLADAVQLRARGVRLMRGGAFKPRTSPYSFQGHGAAGLEMFAAVREATGIGIVTEVLAVEDVEQVAAVADMLQVGARNMQNFRLLDAVGRSGVPVLLKRGIAATLDELLCAAEYIMAAGSPNVVLCERGTRGFEPQLRGTLDLGAVALLRTLTHLPVIVDPSHATGVAALVRPVALGCLAAGADGVMVEATIDPATAVVDGDQTITMPELGRLIEQATALITADGRQLNRLREPASEHDDRAAKLHDERTTSAA